MLKWNGWGQRREVNIKNVTYFHLDDLLNINDFDLENIVLNNITTYNETFISYLGYKILYSGRCLRFIFYKISGYIEDYKGSKYLTPIPGEEKTKFCWKNIRNN